MPHARPNVVVIGGPNGAGKTTLSRAVIAETLGMTEFVNADVIAQGLSGFDPERAAMQAGRVMLLRLRELAEARADFAFESTLSSRTFAPWLSGLQRAGYRVHVIFVFLNSPDLAVRRVKARFRRGGHFVPPEVVRRRYGRAVRNLVDLYIPLADTWHVYDNSTGEGAGLVAKGVAGSSPIVHEPQSWEQLHGIARKQSAADDH